MNPIKISNQFKHVYLMSRFTKLKSSFTSKYWKCRFFQLHKVLELLRVSSIGCDTVQKEYLGNHLHVPGVWWIWMREDIELITAIYWRMQPLHTGFISDAGGNNITVHWYNRRSNLHHVRPMTCPIKTLILQLAFQSSLFSSIDEGCVQCSLVWRQWLLLWGFCDLLQGCVA